MWGHWHCLGRGKKGKGFVLGESLIKLESFLWWEKCFNRIQHFSTRAKRSKWRCRLNDSIEKEDEAIRDLFTDIVWRRSHHCSWRRFNLRRPFGTEKKENFKSSKVFNEPEMSWSFSIDSKTLVTLGPSITNIHSRTNPFQARGDFLINQRSFQWPASIHSSSPTINFHLFSYFLKAKT